jgi:quinone-modifying oxidoreductase subunit QmoC
MANERLKIQPDLEFIQEVLDNGGDSLKKCFQCGTCSVVCNLTPDDDPFPRKEMIWAQWGQKQKLLADPAVWTCYQCGDCSTFCPRGARPGDVLGAIRKTVIETIAFPRFMGKAVGDPHYWAFLFLAPALILLAIIFFNGAGFMNEHPVVYGHMISHLQMNMVFPFFTGLAALAFLVGINRMWEASSGESLLAFSLKALKENGILKLVMDFAGGQGPMFTAVKDVLVGILTHKDFDRCDANKSRRLAHLLVFYAFMGLLLTTVLAIVVLVADEYLGYDGLGVYPLRPLHPIKWLGNGSAIALILGAGLMIANRGRKAKTGEMKSSTFDLFFLYIILFVGITGFVAQVLRFLDLSLLGYSTYFLHLVLVFSLLVYSPYSKFAHFVYRTVALIHGRYQELETAKAEAPATSETQAA